MSQIYPGSDLLKYIIDEDLQPGDGLPAIKDLAGSDILGGSSGKIREQLAVVKAMGLVETRTRTGSRLKEFSFAPSVRLGLFYALARNDDAFDSFSQVRVHLESAFWEEACACITDETITIMRDCIEQARAKLNGTRIQIPNAEHRRFHLTLFQQLNNPFVPGLLEAYWDAYDAIAPQLYMDYEYLQTVWNYHERILDAICEEDFARAKADFIEHTTLLRHTRSNHRDGS